MCDQAKIYRQKRSEAEMPDAWEKFWDEEGWGFSTLEVSWGKGSNKIYTPYVPVVVALPLVISDTGNPLTPGNAIGIALVGMGCQKETRRPEKRGLLES